jgi:hypothetical protein
VVLCTLAFIFMLIERAVVGDGTNDEIDDMASTMVWAVFLGNEVIQD